MAELDSKKGYQMTPTQEYECLIVQLLGTNDINQTSLYIATMIEDYLKNEIDLNMFSQVLRRTDYGGMHQELWDLAVVQLIDKFREDVVIEGLKKIFIQNGWEIQ